MYNRKKSSKWLKKSHYQYLYNCRGKISMGTPNSMACQIASYLHLAAKRANLTPI